jgi:indole-3-glycerol phosphate synthase
VDADPGAQAEAYERGGAAAVSVVTEPRHFQGSLLDLRAARRRTALPLMRTDFVVHPAQVIESRAEGADAVLLIAAALSAAELDALLAMARDVGLFTLVEAQTAVDLERAVASGAPIVGVNARNLESLDVDLDGALELARVVADERVVVVESGLSTRNDVLRAEEAGARAVLVGEALMRSTSPARMIRKLRGTLAPVPSVGSGDDG